MASAIAAARQQINDVGADGDLDGARAPGEIDLDARRDRRPDRAARRQAHLPAHAARRADRRARLRAARHAATRPVAVPAPDRPARHGQEPDRARDRLPAVDRSAAGAIETRHGEPFYGFVEMSGGPSSDEFTFRYEYVPDAEHPGDVRLVDSPRSSRRCARLGGDDRRGQHDPRRRAAVAQRHARRPPLAVPARRPARPSSPGPGFAVHARLQPRPGRRHRHPRRLALALPRHARGHQQLAGARQARRRRAARREAAMALDRQRIAGDDGLVWTPQFRDIEALWHMIERVGERAAAVAVLLQPARADRRPARSRTPRRAAACRMLDQAGYGAPEGRRRGGSRTCTATRAR